MDFDGLVSVYGATGAGKGVGKLTINFRVLKKFAIATKTCGLMSAALVTVLSGFLATQSWARIDSRPGVLPRKG